MTLHLSFVVTTPEDKGLLARHIQAINSHSATRKHQRSRAAQIRIHAADPAFVVHVSTLQANAGESVGDKHSALTIIPRSKLGAPQASNPASLIMQPTNLGSLPLFNQNAIFDRLLQSTLDPFIKLPVEISRHERSLLHAWLIGSERLPLKVVDDVFNATFYAANLMLQADPMYVLTHVTMGEWIRCKRTGTAPTKLFYLRRSEAYRYMLNLVETPCSPFLSQVSGLVQLSILELLLNEHKLQALHLKALYKLIECSGGLLQSSTFWNGDGPRLSIGFVVAFFIMLDMPISTSESLNEIANDFQQALQYSVDLKIAPITGHGGHKETFHIKSLRRHIARLRDTHLNTNATPFHEQAGVLAFLFSLTATIRIYDLRGQACLRFLERLAACMDAGKVANENRPSPILPLNDYPLALTWLTWHVRSTRLCTTEQKEAELSHSLINFLRVLRLLRHATKLKLALVLSLLAFSTIDPQNSSLPIKDEIEDIVGEIKQNWSPPES